MDSRIYRGFELALYIVLFLFIFWFAFHSVVVKPNAPLPVYQIHKYVKHIKQHDDNIVNVVVGPKKAIVIIVVNSSDDIDQQYAKNMCPVVHASGLDQVELIRIMNKQSYGWGLPLGNSLFSIDYRTDALALCMEY